MNEPTKVYVVTQGEYSDRRNIGVFTTREKADAAVTFADDNPCYVEEWILDNQSGAPGHYNYFFIVMDRAGNVRRSQTDTHFGLHKQPEMVRPYPMGNRDEQGCYYFHEYGTDLTQAIKIANEKRVQLIAENKWGVV